jgi:hypothetical protein
MLSVTTRSIASGLIPRRPACARVATAKGAQAATMSVPTSILTWLPGESTNWGGSGSDEGHEMYCAYIESGPVSVHEFGSYGIRLPSDHNRSPGDRSAQAR